MYNIARIISASIGKGIPPSLDRRIAVSLAFHDASSRLALRYGIEVWTGRMPTQFIMTVLDAYFLLRRLAMKASQTRIIDECSNLSMNANRMNVAHTT